MTSPARITALQRPYFLLLLSMALVLSAAVALLNVQLRGKLHADQLATLKLAAIQTEKMLEQKVELATYHVAAMQQTVNRALAQPQLADPGLLQRLPGVLPADSVFESLPAGLAGQLGSFYVRRDFWPQNRPALAAALPQAERQRLAASLAILPVAAHAHRSHRDLQWSYYYDAAGRYSLLYPGLSRKEVLGATDSRDMDSALGIIFDAGGTLPVQLAGPQRNPLRQKQWTTPYMDSGGKGMMVSLLAPVYRGGEYIGAVGADLTLSMLDRALQDSATPLLNTLIIDNSGQVIADSQGALQGRSHALQAAERLDHWLAIKALPQQGGFTRIGERYWLSLPIAGTPWELLGHVEDRELTAATSAVLDNYLRLSLLVMGMLILLVWLLHRYYTRPALQLADYVFAVNEQAGSDMPPVPARWTPWFRQVAQTAEERASYLARMQEHAEQLEERVAERTHSLQSVNAELARALQELGNTQERMVEGRKMAALGRLTSGMAHELNTPLGVVLTAVSSLLEDQSRLSTALADNRIGKAAVLRELEQSQETNTLILRNVQRAIGLIQNLRQLGQAQDNELPQRVRLAGLLAELAQAYRARFDAAGHRLQIQCPPDLELLTYQHVLSQTLGLLLDNALLHGLRERADGLVDITVRSDGSEVVITLADNGRGLDGPGLQRLFDPFYTSQFGQHHGLGTFMAYSFVTGLLQGRIQPASQPGAGLSYHIELPLTLSL
ncbi:ATP-binding protein [Chitinilyticum litopenaei]|uniref:ATP-binding protein n=1 Tax=Chitinilyticum litopenaei TaxID=1121276 RepID=UPI0003F5934E|nr:ATP-binding protein [Chitinilyticum litopenaei]